MKKLRLCTLFILLMVLMLSVSVNASDSPKLVDNENLLTEKEAEKINQLLEEKSADNDVDIVIVTTDSVSQNGALDDADVFYDTNGYGNDGVLLYLSMGNRDYAISTTGFGQTAFTSAGLEYMEDQFVSDLSKGNYYDAFEEFVTLSDDYIKQARKGNAYDTGNLPKAKRNYGLYALISAALGCLMSAFSTGQKKAKNKSVHAQKYANSYIKDTNITLKRDIFLYHTINRVRKEKQERSGGSGNGGHISSSGHSHGGTSGKF